MKQLATGVVSVITAAAVTLAVMFGSASDARRPPSAERSGGTSQQHADSQTECFGNSDDWCVSYLPANNGLSFVGANGTAIFQDSCGFYLPAGCDMNISGDLGSTAAELESVYIGDLKGLYFGADQDWRILNDSSASNTWKFQTGGGSTFMQMSGSVIYTVDLLSLNAGGEDIGGTANEYRALLLGDNNGIYLGLDQDHNIKNNASNNNSLDITGSPTGAGVRVLTSGFVPAKVTADPCGESEYPEGSIFWNDTSNVLCYCDASAVDLRVTDGTTACF